MNEPAIPESSFAAAFEHARRAYAEGRYAEAELAYRRLLQHGCPREPVLRALVELYMRARRPADAIDALVALTEEVPDSLYYFARLATLLEAAGHVEAAIGHYRRLLRRRPDLAAAHYNIALLQKQIGDVDAAVESYETAIMLGIERVEEVYSNLGVLFAERRDAQRAREMYARAMAVNPDYVPALFNLAALHEELGARDEAIALYERVLSLDPRHWASLGRLAHAATAADGPRLLQRLEQAVRDTSEDPRQQEGLYFALGKILDDMGRYREAFAAYEAGNRLVRARAGGHDRLQVERSMDAISSSIDADWIRGHATDLDDRPIFICGMFRSGSTLVEKILAAHPDVTAGGELNHLPWLVQRHLGAFPKQAAGASREDLATVGRAYLARLGAQFPGSANVTDKQPTNFLLLGVIKSVFPRARIVYTRRNVPDMCLSIFFQHMDESLTYATDPADIVHYFRQHERLMAHWHACFGADIHTVDYDELVRAPEPVVQNLVAFLGLPWDKRCLAFQEAPGMVATASLWQVRAPLHTRSSGRWRNYRDQLACFGFTG